MINGLYRQWLSLHTASETALTVEHGKAIVKQMSAIKETIRIIPASNLSHIIIKLSLCIECGDMDLIESAIHDLYAHEKAA